jgi:flagellar basal-body rod modification protein FlgD
VAVDTVPPVGSNTQTNTQNKTQNTDQSQSTSDTKSATLNYDSFLKLLVAQMKNQDPTDPVDATQQMSQLASFSNVEQSIKTNAHLESLISETSLSQATSLVGKTVTSADGKTSGVVASVAINSDGLTATTKDGHKISIETGITVAATSDSNSTTPPPTNNSGE